MPAADVQLSRNFWLHEAPCWEKAQAYQVARLQESSARVLQPLRNQFGPVDITSWIWWSGNCQKRAGAHSHGGTVDLVVSGGQTFEAWEWGNTFLMPTGYIGRWIYEPETETQGEHIHMAPRADMLAVFGDGAIKSLRETEDGNVYLFWEWVEGTYADPYDVEGFTVTVPQGFGWLLPFVVLAGALGLATRAPSAAPYRLGVA